MDCRVLKSFRLKPLELFEVGVISEYWRLASPIGVTSSSFLNIKCVMSYDVPFPLKYFGLGREVLLL